MPPSFAHGGCRNTDPVEFKRYYNDSGDFIGLCCNRCLSEWVEGRFLPDGNHEREKMLISLFLKEKPNVDMDECTVYAGCTRVDDFWNLAEYLKAGRHVRYPWFSKMRHHAIVKRVERDDNGNDQVTLIHWQGGRGNSFNVKFTATVKMEPMDIPKIEYIEILDYGCNVVQEDPQELTLARATAWIGAGGYNLLDNNCEHFAVFCKIGTHHSFQASWYLKMVMISFRESARAMAYMYTSVDDVVDDVVDYAVKDAVKDAMNYAAKDVAVDIAEYSLVRLLDDVTIPTEELIGLGMVAVFQGSLLILDVTMLFTDRRNRNHNKTSFVQELWKRVYCRLETTFYTGAMPTACNIALKAMCPAGILSAPLMLVLGIVVSKVICDPWGAHEIACSVINTVARYSPYVHCDVAVEDIGHMKPGDHIVLLKWLLHPRCHMIVTEVQTSQLKLKVIRFTYSDGVVEETIPFQKPVYKVLHSESLKDSEVIANARESQRNGASRYNIVTFNCKHWAFWCKIGRTPLLP